MRVFMGILQCNIHQGSKTRKRKDISFGKEETNSLFADDC